MNTPLGTMIWCSMVVKQIQLRREKIQSNSGGSEYKSSTSSTPKKSRLRWGSLKKTSINAVREATNVGLFQPTPRSKLKVSHLYKVMWTNESQSEWVIDWHLDEAIHDHAKRKLSMLNNFISLLFIKFPGSKAAQGPRNHLFNKQPSLTHFHTQLANHKSTSQKIRGPADSF